MDRFNAVAPADPGDYMPFVIDDALVGFTQPDFAKALLDDGSAFQQVDGVLLLHRDLRDIDSRNKAVGACLKNLHRQGLIPHWRDEFYPVKVSWDASPVLVIERAAAGLFGIRAFGVHLNGIVQKRDGLHMWIGKRADDKPVAPGKLDQLVAGGQPHGLSVMENLVKECAEEAAIPKSLALAATPVGAITYRTGQQPQGLRWDTLFNFDLILDVGFIPENTDGELQSFELMPIETVMALVRDTDDFKFNCALVIIDFLIRWGYIGPENPDYLRLISALHD